MKTSGLLLASLITLALGEPATPNLKLHEILEGTPGGFSRIGSVNPDQRLQLRLALPRRNVAELERKLYDVRTPSSPNYGKHLSKSEVRQLVAPAQGSADAVNAWLNENGVSTNMISTTGNRLSFEVPVGKANELLAADFSVFRHDDTGEEAVRTLSYSIPTELQRHIDLIHPTVSFPDPMDRLPAFQTHVESMRGFENFTARSVPSSCSESITLACLQFIYNIPNDAATKPSSNRLAVAGFLKQYANRADLRTFLHQSQPGWAEANLDTQYTVGIATSVPTVFISMGYSTIDAWLDLADFLLDQDSPPSFLTTSYCFQEHTISPKLARNLCDLYAQLGARGVSVLFASGDGGVSGTRFSNTCKSFVPTFPPSCPFVTSVGASRSVPETSAALSPGGGFSNVFSMPPYQAPRAVPHYLSALGRTHEGLYNASGRAYPDVAAQGVAFRIVVGGEERLINGTSASSPVFASVVALLNDRLAAKGRPPLGFLNPLLYSPAGMAALNDIATGSNLACGTSGFPAKEGWDPAAVTGLGTDFEKLAGAIGV
ncbi:hypothetical protein GSI_04642 [Ganoderma sinense ZZ0214-1]|uniref:Peptidase S53 domain-containing protein n=1 Tax=Ganoderma sinense ZZ0214-1 TaxID=1077348 RepID=A0A2G8SHF0_9APHY|nr:hypothetical protein GSI_04642 [Ganoderma sinense ZZ0214-1]